MVLLLSTLLVATPELEEGRVLFAALKYQAAIPKLATAAKDGRATVAERIEANDLLARAALAVGRGPLAEDAWEALLALDPMAEPPKAAPKVVASFERAKRRRFRPDFVELARVDRAPDIIEVRVINPWRLPLVVELRESTGGPFTARAMPVDSAGQAIATLTSGSRFFVRALRDGAPLASLGSETDPLAGPPARAAEPQAPAPPPLPEQTRAPADAPTTSEPLDSVVNPRVLPLNTAVLPGAGSGAQRFLGWALVAAGVLLTVAGLAWGGWGVWEVDRSMQGALTSTEMRRLRESGEQRMLVGGLGIALGVTGAVVGGILVGTAPAPGSASP